MLAKLVAIYLVSSTSGDAVATTAPKRVRVDQSVTLVAVAKDDKGALWTDRARKVDIGGGVRSAKAWDDALLGAPSVSWKKIEPTAEWVDNERGGFHWEEIPYVATAIEGTALSRVADVHTTVLPDRGGLGTMHFQVTVGSLSSPGLEKRFRGGLAEDVHRVSVRRDDSFLGYLTELFNTPYIWASAGDDAIHQAERGVGSDCADFIAYGLRRSGRSIKYGSTFDVPKWGAKKPIASIAAREGDRFVDANGNAIAVGGERGVRAGDLLLFTRHVGAFVEDREPLGVLDANDVLIHTAWAPPTEESLDDSAKWTSPPFAIYRVR